VPNQKISDLTGLTAARGDLIPVDRSGADGHVSAAGIYAASADYVDIRDYGTVAGSFGDITAAFVAAIQAYGVTHKLRRIRVPMVGDGVYQLDGTTLKATYEGGGGPWIFEFDCVSIYLTSKFCLTSGMTVRGIRNAPYSVFTSLPAPGPGFYLYDGNNDVTFETWDQVSPTACTNWLIENVQIGGNVTNGTGLHARGGSLGTIRNCWFTSAGPGWPLHINTMFWLTVENIYAQSRAAGDYACIRLSTDENNPTLATGLIRMKEVRLARAGIEFHATGAAAANVNNTELYDVLCEGMVGGQCLFSFNSVVQQVGQIKIIRPAIADAVSGTVYLLKNVASSAQTTSGIYIEGSGMPVIGSGSTQFWDPSSTHPISNLTIVDNTHDNYGSGATPQLADIYADYPNWGQWTRHYQNSIDAKLATAPVPGANWNYGTPYSINTDPANWTAMSGAITTGYTGPDGSTMAARCTGRTKMLEATGQTLALGDWLIAGVWTTAIPGTDASIVVGTAIGTQPSGGFVFSGDNGSDYDMARDADAIVRDGWRWICQARKVTTAGSNPCTVTFEANVGGSSGLLYFGPSAMRIPAGLVDDAWPIKIARMLRGGWSGGSPAGTVSILDHQRFWSGSGMAIKDGVTAPSAVSGWSQIYIDSAGTVPKIKYGGGAVKTLGVATSSAIPTTGTATRGDVSFNSNAAQGEPMGWQCVASGTPGTWVQMPNLEYKSQGAFTGSGTGAFVGGTAVGAAQGALSATGTGTGAFIGANASSLLLNETEGFSFDATVSGGLVNVDDNSFPANNLTNVTLNASNLVQSSASAKVVLGSSLTLSTVSAGDIPQQWDIDRSLYGILVEPAATNLQLRSQTLDNAGEWGLSDASITADTTAAPDGTTTADTLTTTHSSNAGIVLGNNMTVSNPSTCTASVYAKTGDVTWIAFSVTNGVNVGRRVWFDIANGTVGTNSAVGAGWTLVSSAIQSLANGWYRCQVTLTVTATDPQLELWAVSGDGVLTGPGISKTAIFWGAQFETGSFATSYIATAGATVTRAADVISVDTDTFPWSDSVGTLYMDYKPFDVSAGTRYAWDAYKDANNRISLFGSAADPTMGNVALGVTNVASDLGTLLANTRTQITVAYGSNDFDGSQDGAAATSDSVCTINTAYDPLYIGTTGTTGSELHGYIYRLAYVPRQVETDANNIETWRYNF
jgi:hypothetical protein